MAFPQVCEEEIVIFNYEEIYEEDCAPGHPGQPY